MESPLWRRYWRIQRGKAIDRPLKSILKSYLIRDEMRPPNSRTQILDLGNLLRAFHEMEKTEIKTFLNKVRSRRSKESFEMPQGQRTLAILTNKKICKKSRVETFKTQTHLHGHFDLTSRARELCGHGSICSTGLQSGYRSVSVALELAH